MKPSRGAGFLGGCFGIWGCKPANLQTHFWGLSLSKSRAYGTIIAWSPGRTRLFCRNRMLTQALSLH
ncbi:hypothetical protein CCP4SC76_7810006 [Gammaproteobacteria bacterium]